MNESELKKKFAFILLEEKNPFKAALRLFPEDEENTGEALRIAHTWPGDEDVLKYQEKFIEEGLDLKLLPSKAELAKDVWDRMQSFVADEDYVKLAKLYADIRGFIEKPGTQVNVQNVSNKVMVVREKENDEIWGKGLIEQQERLISESN